MVPIHPAALIVHGLVQRADFVLKLRHHQLMAAAQLAVAADNRAGRGFDAAADLLDIVARSQGFQPFHFLAKLEFAIGPAAGDALREHFHGGGGVLQILAHPGHLFAGLIAIIAEFSPRKEACTAL